MAYITDQQLNNFIPHRYKPVIGKLIQNFQLEVLIAETKKRFMGAG